MPVIFNKRQQFIFDQGIDSVCVRACVHAGMLENVCLCMCGCVHVNSV